MAEAIIRQHKRRTDRWLPKERRHITRTQLKRVAGCILRSMPGYLLSFADVLGIPSGLHAAYAAALGMVGKDVRPTVLGAAAAVVVRVISGLEPRWEGLLVLPMLLFAPLLHGRGTPALMIFAALSALPGAVAASLAPTAAEMLRGWAAMVIAVLSAPMMVRAVNVLSGSKSIAALEERIAVGYLAAMCICGGARMLLLGLNVGVLLSSCITLSMALVMGVGPAVMTGMLSGLVLALQGLPLTVSVALSLGGFMAGVAQSLGRRRLSCGFFAMAAYLPLLLCGATRMGCGTAVLAAALLTGLLPRTVCEHIQQLLRRFHAGHPASGDAYAASALSAWEQTVAAMARAVPSPRDAALERDGAWWEAHLCQGCPECERCGCLTTELGITKAEAVWKYRHAHEDVWQGALEGLRGMGCQRLYYLLDAMNALRREDEAEQKVIHQAEAQRDMLVTHLTAMSGAARRFALLSSGESWWDDMAARRIRRELSERAMPVTLAYVRRVQGHAQAAFELQFITGARRQAEDLCVLSSAVLEVPMQLAELDGDRVLLTETPLLHAEIGMAAEPISGGSVCGDTAWSGLLQDGRCLVALSDGMGHGDQAALSSRQTVELLRLCLDAGYSRRQTLTAVNGMLLLGGGGERFATADVLTIDLWKGHAALDKLGAAASWLYQNGALSRLTGDALPLGILEDIDLSGSTLRLDAGDALVLLTDGVEDAFRTVSALEDAIRIALKSETPDAAAEALISAAAQADEGQRRDDQSAVVVFIRRTNRPQPLQAPAEQL